MNSSEGDKDNDEESSSSDPLANLKKITMILNKTWDKKIHLDFELTKSMKAFR